VLYNFVDTFVFGCVGGAVITCLACPPTFFGGTSLTGDLTLVRWQSARGTDLCVLCLSFFLSIRSPASNRIMYQEMDKIPHFSLCFVYFSEGWIYACYCRF